MFRSWRAGRSAVSAGAASAAAAASCMRAAASACCIVAPAVSSPCACVAAFHSHGLHHVHADRSTPRSTTRSRELRRKQHSPMRRGGKHQHAVSLSPEAAAALAAEEAAILAWRPPSFAAARGLSAPASASEQSSASVDQLQLVWRTLDAVASAAACDSSDRREALPEEHALLPELARDEVPQALPLQWLLKDMDEILSPPSQPTAAVDLPSAEASDGATEAVAAAASPLPPPAAPFVSARKLSHANLLRCDQILRELHAMILVAPEHPSHALTLANYSSIFACTLASGQVDAEQTASATSAVDLLQYVMPFARLLLAQVEMALVLPLRESNSGTLLERREFIATWRHRRPLLRLMPARLREIMQCVSSAGTARTRTATTRFAATSLHHLVTEEDERAREESAMAAARADHPFDSILSGVQTQAKQRVDEDDVEANAEASHTLVLLRYVNMRVQELPPSEPLDSAKYQALMAEGTKLLTRLLKLVSSTAQMKPKDFLRVLNVYVPRFHAPQLSLPLFEALLVQLQREMAKIPRRADATDPVVVPSGLIVPSKTLESVLLSVGQSESLEAAQALCTRLHTQRNEFASLTPDACNVLLTLQAGRNQQRAMEDVPPDTYKRRRAAIQQQRLALAKQTLALERSLPLRNAHTDTLLLEALAWSRQRTAVLECYQRLQATPDVTLPAEAYTVVMNSLCSQLHEQREDEVDRITHAQAVAARSAFRGVLAPAVEAKALAAAETAEVKLDETVMAVYADATQRQKLSSSFTTALARYRMIRGYPKKLLALLQELVEIERAQQAAAAAASEPLPPPLLKPQAFAFALKLCAASTHAKELFPRVMQLLQSAESLAPGRELRVRTLTLLDTFAYLRATRAPMQSLLDTWRSVSAVTRRAHTKQGFTVEEVLLYAGSSAGTERATADLQAVHEFAATLDADRPAPDRTLWSVSMASALLKVHRLHAAVCKDLGGSATLCEAAERVWAAMPSRHVLPDGDCFVEMFRTTMYRAKLEQVRSGVKHKAQETAAIRGPAALRLESVRAELAAQELAAGGSPVLALNHVFTLVSSAHTCELASEVFAWREYAQRHNMQLDVLNRRHHAAFRWARQRMQQHAKVQQKQASQAIQESTEELTSPPVVPAPTADAATRPAARVAAPSSSSSPPAPAASDAHAFRVSQLRSLLFPAAAPASTGDASSSP